MHHLCGEFCGVEMKNKNVSGFFHSPASSHARSPILKKKKKNSRLPLPQPSSYIYGISDNRVIFETDVNAKTNREVLDADPYIAPGQPNAFAVRADFFHFFSLGS